MAVLASDLLKRKKEEVYVGGYLIDTAETVAGSVNAGEETFAFFGTDNILSDVTVNHGRLSITIFDKRANNRLLDVLTLNDPDANITPRRYKWEDVKSISVWINRKQTDNTMYLRGSLYQDWIPVPGMTEGNVTARGMRVFQGNCDIPLEYNWPVRGVKVKLRSGAGSTPNFQAEFSVPFQQIPGEASGIYAVQILAINEQRIGTGPMPSAFDYEDLTLTPGMFSGAGTGLNLRQADLQTLTWMTHAYVIGIYNSAVGIHPNVRQIGILETVTQSQM